MINSKVIEATDNIFISAIAPIPQEYIDQFGPVEGYLGGGSLAPLYFWGYPRDPLSQAEEPIYDNTLGLTLFDAAYQSKIHYPDGSYLPYYYIHPDNGLFVLDRSWPEKPLDVAKKNYLEALAAYYDTLLHRSESYWVSFYDETAKKHWIPLGFHHDVDESDIFQIISSALASRHTHIDPENPWTHSCFEHNKMECVIQRQQCLEMYSPLVEWLNKMSNEYRLRKVTVSTATTNEEIREACPLRVEDWPLPPVGPSEDTSLASVELTFGNPPQTISVDVTASELLADVPRNVTSIRIEAIATDPLASVTLNLVDTVCPFPLGQEHICPHIIVQAEHPGITESHELIINRVPV